MMYVIACIKDNKTIGFWDAETLQIRTRTICFYKNKTEALSDFDKASPFIAQNYDGVLISLSTVSVSISLDSMIESFDRHLDTITRHWPHLPERVKPTQEAIKKYK